jgi:hypothetical protein
VILISLGLTALGVIAMVTVAVLCSLPVAGHLGDIVPRENADFGLLVLLLIVWFLPMAASLLLFGLATRVFGHGHRFSLARRVAAWVLRAGAAYFLVLVMLLLGSSLPHDSEVISWTRFVVFGLELLAFPVTQWICAHTLSREGALEWRERRAIAMAVGAITLVLLCSIVTLARDYPLLAIWPMLLWPIAGFVAWWSLRRETPTESAAPAA